MPAPVSLKNIYYIAFNLFNISLFFFKYNTVFSEVQQVIFLRYYTFLLEKFYHFVLNAIRVMMDLDLRMSVSLFIPPHPFSLLLFVGRNGKLPLSTLPYEFDEDQASAASHV